MTTVTLARSAMATRFELVLHGANEVALQAAGEQAFEEIARLEAQLSLYRSTSELARINACAARQAVRVEPHLFQLLQHAQRLHRESQGAFDITIGPLMRCWGFLRDTGRLPSPDQLAQARDRVGLHLVELDPAHYTVRFAREGVMLDLGAIGKGYAIERAVEILREAGVTSALLHGGTSTVYALGHPPETEAWKVGIEFQDPTRSLAIPAESSHPPSAGIVRFWKLRSGDRQDACPTSLAVVPLADEALSVSAVWGKAFQTEDKVYGHVIDPRSGAPVDHALLAAVILPSATETDALSTALLTAGQAGHEGIAGLRPGMRTLLAGRGEKAGEPWVETKGIDRM